MNRTLHQVQEVVSVLTATHHKAFEEWAKNK